MGLLNCCRSFSDMSTFTNILELCIRWNAFIFGRFHRRLVAATHVNMHVKLSEHLLADQWMIWSLSTSLALCEEKRPTPVDSHHKSLSMWNFDVPSPDKLNKQSNYRWFETPGHTRDVTTTLLSLLMILIDDTARYLESCYTLYFII